MEYRLFKLGMPNNNAWNGRWTGEGKFYGIIRAYNPHSIALQNVDKKDSHYYNFEDGWGASVSIEKTSGKYSRKLKKRSEGFCGYDWMVNEIENHGRILTRTERHEKEAEDEKKKAREETRKAWRGYKDFIFYMNQKGLSVNFDDNENVKKLSEEIRQIGEFDESDIPF